MIDIPAKLARTIIVVLTVLVLLSLVFAVRSCQSARTAKTVEKLATGQTDAALKSGTDAVNTIGNRMDADASTDATTRENEDAIRNAEGADAPVAGGVRDAGLAGLCRRAAYRSDPKCMQHADPR